jgi:hypothetical protein
VSVCQPLAEATEDSSGEKYPTRSMVIPILFGIFDKLQKFISDPKSKGTGVMFARKLLTALQDRFLITRLLYQTVSAHILILALKTCSSTVKRCLLFSRSLKHFFRKLSAR